MRFDEMLRGSWVTGTDNGMFNGNIMAVVPFRCPHLVAVVEDGDARAGEAIAALPDLRRALRRLLDLPDAFVFGRSAEEDEAVAFAQEVLAKVEGRPHPCPA